MSIETIIRNIVREELSALMKEKSFLTRLPDDVPKINYRDLDHVKTLADKKVISTRAVNVLQSINVNTIQDVKGLTISELCTARNCGRKTIEEVKMLIYELSK
jgi:DNA-directed RNA polymerase alpha subunit